MENNRPVAKFRDGHMEIAIWRNHHNDREHFSLSISRSYKDANDEWVDRSLSLNDREIARSICLLSEGYRSILSFKNA